MAPEHDGTPKAPDKADSERTTTDDDDDSNAEQGKEQEASVLNLDDRELKKLLEEAITYKNPKDRKKMSPLFNNLLNKAEESERSARATSASGSELVRHCNTSARRRCRSRRSATSSSSIAENVTHGGSLNNLAKDELYSEPASHPKRKTVSARPREGGSLPCDVNVGTTLDRTFLEEARRDKKGSEYAAANVESESLSETLMEQGSLIKEFTQTEIVPTRIPRISMKYTTSATLHVGNVDDGITLSQLDGPTTEKTGDNSCEMVAQSQSRPLNTKYLISGSSIFNRGPIEDKKVDENGNALGQNSTDTKKNKKKKIQTEKNVVVTEAKNVAGHRADIINDVDKLTEYIKGDENSTTGAKPKNPVHKSKLHKHVGNAEEKSKKRRAGSKGAKNATGDLKKSNSLDEMSSSSKLEDLSNGSADAKVALRSGKNIIDRTRERRSWGNTEQLTFNTSSVENLETAEFRVVTKKKKSKKRRNSISGQSRVDTNTSDFNRIPSPERRTTACSVPHSERSNDSSDAESVHSLPIDANGASNGDEKTISYADIAKNSSPTDKPKLIRKQAEKPKEKMTNKAATMSEFETKPQAVTQGVQTSPKLHLMNLENFPTIQQPKMLPRNGPKVGKTVQNKSMMGKGEAYLQNIQGDLQPMPPNITDVRTIEKMHLAQAQQNNNGSNSCSSSSSSSSSSNNSSNSSSCINDSNYCDNGDRTSVRPAVVIMSGEQKEVSGLVFGFEINEKLLSDDVCDSFMSRFVLPVKMNTTTYNHDKIVSFIGQAWEEVVNNQTNGNVQYYSENL